MINPKLILGIESSCDETSAAILRKDGHKITILSNIVATSLDLHQLYGGVIPEKAARQQLKLIIPVIKQAFNQAFPDFSLNTPNSPISQLDAIAVTQGPGLIGSLLVGVETAKTLAHLWQKPLIPVNHLIGHFYANWVEGSYLPSTGKIQPNPRSADILKSHLPRDTKATQLPTFPCLGLLVSGGHSDLVLFKNHGQFEYLGGTRDDAAGECFDKCARLIGYSYPGGPKISQLASEGNPHSFDLPRPMSDSNDLDFSFSGLKTAFSNLIQKDFNIDPGHYDKQSQTWIQQPLQEQLSQNKLQQINNLCASLEQAIIDSLIIKTLKALTKTKVKTLIVAGGVAANQKLTETLKAEVANLDSKISLHIPPPILCTDNAAMITSAAFFLPPQSTLTIQANPNLSLAY